MSKETDYQKVREMIISTKIRKVELSFHEVTILLKDYTFIRMDYDDYLALDLPDEL